MKSYLKRRALAWSNSVRKRHGLPSVARLSAGMLHNAGDCPLARTIGPATVGLSTVGVFGDVERVPLVVRVFIRWHDRGRFPELIDYRPTPRVDGIDHLDFEPWEADDLVLDLS